MREKEKRHTPRRIPNTCQAWRKKCITSNQTTPFKRYRQWIDGFPSEKLFGCIETSQTRKITTNKEKVISSCRRHYDRHFLFDFVWSMRSYFLVSLSLSLSISLSIGFPNLGRTAQWESIIKLIPFAVLYIWYLECWLVLRSEIFNLFLYPRLLRISWLFNLQNFLCGFEHGGKVTE